MGEEEHTPSPIDIFVVSQALMAGFPLFLAAQAQPYAGQSLKALGRDGFTAFPAAGDTVYPFRAATVHLGAGAQQGGLPVQSFQFRGLIENIHAFLLGKGSGNLAAARLPYE